MKVLVTELIWPEGLEELEAVGEVEYDPELWQEAGELRERSRSADAIIVRDQTRVDAALLESSASLKAVGRLGVGLDNIDLEAAGSKGVPVVFARNANAVSVAEYVMAAVLLASRNLYAAGVDEADLARALDEGLVGGAVLDVLEQEPPRRDNPLLAHERVVLTPRITGLTEEAQVNTSVLVTREVIKVLNGQRSLCMVG